MPEPGAVELLALRGAGALVLGAGCGMLLWLLGWLRLGATLVAGPAVTLAYLGGGWTPGTLVALSAGLPGLARQLGVGRAGNPPPGLVWAATGLAVPTVILLCRPWLPADRWIVALAAGALAGAAADGVLVTGCHLPGRRYLLPSVRPTRDRRGMPAAAVLAGGAAAGAVPTLAWGLGLLAPGDPALVAIAGTAAMLAAATLRGRLGKLDLGAPGPPLVAALAGALAALALVALFP